MNIFLRRTKQLEAQIDDYLDKVDRGALIFIQGLKYYFENRQEEFEQRYRDLRLLESSGDGLRREIENELYAHTLIPEWRGDVLGLLESTDRVLNRLSKTLLNFSIEQPVIPRCCLEFCSGEYGQSYSHLFSRFKCRPGFYQ